MIFLILSAICVGFILSLILIGPVFFLLIETSLTKGIKPAIALEAGVISADVLCIIISHKGSRGIQDFIIAHPSIYMLAGFIFIIYGLYNILSRGNLRLSKETNIATTNYFKTFLNGFLLNLVNIGVIVFWLATVVLISSSYKKHSDFYLYVTIMMITIIAVDLMKILLANKFKDKLTDQIVYRIKKIVGIALITFGIFFFSKSFIKPGSNSKNPIEIIERFNPNQKNN